MVGEEVKRVIAEEGEVHTEYDRERDRVRKEREEEERRDREVNEWVC